MNFRDKLEKLRDVASSRDDELGKYWVSLCETYDDFVLSDHSAFLKKALENKISLEYDGLEEMKCTQTSD